MVTRCLDNGKASNDGAAAARQEIQQVQTDEVYSTFTVRQKRAIVGMVTFAAFFSPLTSNIYYAAVNDMARDLHASPTSINFSFTSYMIAQGLSPMLVAEITESVGRRPAYMLCFVVFLAANVGLAIQHSLSALIGLRVVQAVGSSGTAVLASAVVSDIVTSAERGSYMGYTFAGAFVGQSAGPLLGGILGHFLGWRAIFWFLTILAGVFVILLVLFLPETSRKLVGNGARKATGINMNALDLISSLKGNYANQREMLPRPPFQIPNPLLVLGVFRSVESTIVLLYTALVFSGLAVIAVTIPSLFESRFHFNSLQIGLSFIPSGVGGCLAALVGGRLADRNYQRHAKKLRVPTDRRRPANLASFPIERARVEIVLPLALLSVASAVVYGWVLQATSSIAGPLVLLFFVGFSSAGVFDVMSTLLLDIQPRRAAQASACNNLARCLLGAVASVVAVPLVKAIDVGWTYTLVGLVWLALLPLALYIVIKGPQWRERDQEREMRAASSR